ncbi:hypothetical protein TREMEDRAFT_27301 [Tremella mesenterica DSM 1558]|uniref:uncharacterized protein n=1 Tax=Tremella mesenterica (strain ATCC 24925 / CBS 8224 / DSM 1558 / NBRC 9311 / NRRL Y-6157 / RJB 2259-6 / UBC 559-6) TaxID=578456 RepID=UPI0003F4A55F|nr:uncharacterized protein TREMEDRAFT_27301 [Tremella mesenterica DSM 1558]EIW71572.1 hypothetical protein TREMEDRAFT_27301 [Tremella mesenterica DSM 1558]
MSTTLNPPGVVQPQPQIQQKPEEPTIRGLLPKDEDMIRMLVGQGVMEGLARANRRVYTHPLLLSLWILIGALLDYQFSYFPSPDIPLSTIYPLVGPALVALPILGVVEYLHRPIFTKLLRTTIGAPDLVSPSRYYSQQTNNVFPRGSWVFIHKSEIVGCIMLDHKYPGQSLGTVLGEDDGILGEKGILDQVLLSSDKDQKSKSSGKSVKSDKTTSRRSSKQGVEESEMEGRVVQIRHLDVDLPFRRHKIGTELLAHSLDQKGKDISKKENGESEMMVIVFTNPFTPGGEKFWRKAGFRPLSDVQTEGWERSEKVGLFGWRGRWMGIRRVEWEERRKTIFDKRST